MFSNEFLSNKLFMDNMLSFDKLPVRNVGTEHIPTGAFVQSNGDVLIRLYVPGVENVILLAGASAKNVTMIELHHPSGMPDGVMEGILLYNETRTGLLNVLVKADGRDMLSPDLPMYWGFDHPMNAIEVPDPDNDFLLVRDVPHGQFARNIFYSHAANNWENCYVYTPPGYMKSNEAYPVLYLLHGGGDNELCWEYIGKVSTIMDNLIADGKAEKFLIVTCNGMIRNNGEITGVMDRSFENMLIGDCIPYIEKNYRVKTDKWNRAVAGLSMGSFMTSDLGFGHPELFGSIGNFTAGLNCGDLAQAYTFERPHDAMLQRGAEDFAQNYKVFYRSTTPQEDHPEYFFADDELFDRAGISALPCYHRKLYPERTTKWNSWRMGLRDFAQLIFKP